MGYDVSRVRDQYPALGDGRAWLDGAAGTQVPRVVIDAVAQTYRVGVANQGAPFEASSRGTEIVAQARSAVADLVGAADPRGVVFGPTMTALTYRFAAVLGATWRTGDEIVVTQLDHDANIRPWVQAARRAGVTVRTAAVDPRTTELPVDGVSALLGKRTRLVAVTAASNLVGTRPEVTAITAAARAAGAVSFVDGVHHTAHTHVDLPALGADLYATSAYKWAGPHLAAVVAADPGLLERLHPDRLLPAPATVPERFELGTNPFASLAGVVAAVGHLAGLDDTACGTRRERLAVSRRAAEAHADALGSRMVAGLAATPGVTLYGPPGQRTPTAYFRLAGSAPADVAAALSARGINCWHGYAYAWELAAALRLRESGGAVRTSVNFYNTAAEVDQLLDAVARLAAGH
ncbi:MAG TPA: cysteine desulfurase-like protein [Pseudonocardiaceae bacterium]|nr:cysteine desulfurase-like protein [Pseudonocardiaceae bacterium]